MIEIVLPCRGARGSVPPGGERVYCIEPRADSVGLSHFVLHNAAGNSRTLRTKANASWDLMLLALAHSRAAA